MLCYGADNMNRNYSQNYAMQPYGYYGDYGHYTSPDSAGITASTNSSTELTASDPSTDPSSTPEQILRDVGSQLFPTSLQNQMISSIDGPLPHTLPAVTWGDALVSPTDVSAFTRVPPFDLYSTDHNHRRHPYDWMKRTGAPETQSAPNHARTRTKDKYRVVYSDTQRLELEKEFAFNKYITIQRKRGTVTAAQSNRKTGQNLVPE
ncbi:unnamed protein product [Oikopleura dioica]|uniref:Homeobox domain-containing protein n=1 Tax=Oikopleura dioica TaxID=34765 RepID=E4X9X0_OIKDI|nr:unnamed protein product [Oikopleura dioica]